MIFLSFSHYIYSFFDFLQPKRAECEKECDIYYDRFGDIEYHGYILASKKQNA